MPARLTSTAAFGQVVPGEALVDDPAQAVAARLRGQGDAAHPALGQELQELGVGGVGPQRTDAHGAPGGQNFPAEVTNGGVVAHRGAHQADLAPGRDPGLDLGPQVFKAALPGRAVDKAGGAEAAAPGAAPAGLHQEHLAPLALRGQEVAVGRAGGQFRPDGARPPAPGKPGAASKAARVPSGW